ncbi:MAG: hypothetical protein HY675_06240 [Chloroflexi bacterium]|nr:hypothetical protein [Chloroflexota bacterium]
MAAIAKQLRRVKVTQGSEIAKLLDVARAAPLLIEKDDESYRLILEVAAEDVWADYDPKKVREALASYACTWKDVDLEAVKTLICHAREEQNSGPRPPDRRSSRISPAACKSSSTLFPRLCATQWLKSGLFGRRFGFGCSPRASGLSSVTLAPACYENQSLAPSLGEDGPVPR